MGNSHGSMRPRRLKSGKAEEEEDRKVKSYEAACCAEPELRSFDAALRRRASLAVSAAASGVQVWSMSLRSLRGVTGCLVEMNQEVVRVVLASKHDVWGCADLFVLVEDYFDASLHTLDFLAALDRALRCARDSQFVLHLAVQVQDPPSGTRACSTRCGGSRPTCSRTSSSPRSRRRTGSSWPCWTGYGGCGRFASGAA